MQEETEVVRVTDEVGASAVEYGLLLAGVAAIIVAAVFMFGGAVKGLFTDTCSAISNGSQPHMAMASCT